MLVLNLERSRGGRVMKEETELNEVKGESFAYKTAGELSLSGWCCKRVLLRFKSSFPT